MRIKKNIYTYYMPSVAVRLAIIENMNTETSWGIVLGLKEDSFVWRCFRFGDADLVSSVHYFEGGHSELSSFSGVVLRVHLSEMQGGDLSVASLS